MSRVAPLLAGALFLVSVVSYFVHWPFVVVAGAAVAVLIAAAAVFWAGRRARPLTDEVAARIDRDADLRGELRSAHWFAVRERADDWVRFHLDRAASQFGGITWGDVYPPVRARRAWIATLALVVAAFALPAGVPSWPAAPRLAASASNAAAALPAEDLALLPPELQAQIFDLLAQVEAGTLKAADALARIKQLPGFTNAPPDVQELVAEAVEDARRRQQEGTHGGAPDAAPAPTSTTDVQWARENTASRMANEQARSNEQAPSAEQQAAGESTKSEQAALGESGEASSGQASAKVPTRDPAAAQGATGMMMQNGESGDPGSAFGGKKGNVQYGTMPATELAAALKREQVEAAANVDTSDLRNEDKRRRTEQSWSAIRYSRVARRSAFDRARVDAPRLVPEARRPLVERYFVRQPAPADQPGAAPPATAPNRRE